MYNTSKFDVLEASTKAIYDVEGLFIEWKEWRQQLEKVLKYSYKSILLKKQKSSFCLCGHCLR